MNPPFIYLSSNYSNTSAALSGFRIVSTQWPILNQWLCSSYTEPTPIGKPDVQGVIALYKAFADPSQKQRHFCTARTLIYNDRRMMPSNLFVLLRNTFYYLHTSTSRRLIAKASKGVCRHNRMFSTSTITCCVIPADFAQRNGVWTLSHLRTVFGRCDTARNTGSWTDTRYLDRSNRLQACGHTEPLSNALTNRLDNGGTTRTADR